MPGPQPQAPAKGPRTFTEAFRHVLLNRLGISPTSRPLCQEHMDREIELASRLDGTAGEDLGSLSAGPADEGNTPGTYIVVQDAIPVTSGQEPSTPAIGRLDAGSVAVVTEVVTCSEDRSLRGRLEHPAGWISLASFDGVQRWARREVEPKWSDQAEELQRLVQKLGPRNANLSSEAFIKPFFKHLLLPQLAIRQIDQDISKFTGLTYLDISRNTLTTIEHLPPCLKFLKAYNTGIARISCRPAPSLCFLGLGHCPMGPLGLAEAGQCFSNLLSLDMSYTKVVGPTEVARSLGPLQRLRHLCLAGSPVSLLPQYRLLVLRWLPQLQALDGAGVTEEDTADVKLLAAAVAAWRRPEALRIAVQPLALTSARALLAPVAEGILAARRAELEAAVAAAAAAGESDEVLAGMRGRLEELESKDTVKEACGGGVLRLCFRLPCGTWAQTAEVPLDVGTAEASDGEPFDSVELSRLRRPSGEPLLFEVDMCQDEEAGGLASLCSWARTGLAVKVCFRPAPPPDPNAVEEEAAPPAKGNKGGGRSATPQGKRAQSPSKAEKEIPAPSAETPDEEVGEPAPLPEEVAIGGTVVPLDVFFRRAEALTPEAREAGQLPDVPVPCVHEVPAARVVPADRWLAPEVQVPLAERAQKKSDAEPAASLALRVVLHAQEVEDEAAPPPEESPKAASPKGKAGRK